jgi:hypothetical protein
MALTSSLTFSIIPQHPVKKASIFVGDQNLAKKTFKNFLQKKGTAWRAVPLPKSWLGGR